MSFFAELEDLHAASVDWFRDGAGETLTVAVGEESAEVTIAAAVEGQPIKAAGYVHELAQAVDISRADADRLGIVDRCRVTVRGKKADGTVVTHPAKVMVIETDLAVPWLILRLQAP